MLGTALLCASFLVKKHAAAARARPREQRASSSPGAISSGCWPTLVVNSVLLPLNAWRIWEIRQAHRGDRRGRPRTRRSRSGCCRTCTAARSRPARCCSAGETRPTGSSTSRAASSGSRRSGSGSGAGELIGEIGLFSPDRKRTQTVVCETDGELYEMTDEMMFQLYYQNPKLGFYFMRLVSATAAEGRATARRPAGCRFVEGSGLERGETMCRVLVAVGLSILLCGCSRVVRDHQVERPRLRRGHRRHHQQAAGDERPARARQGPAAFRRYSGDPGVHAGVGHRCVPAMSWAPIPLRPLRPMRDIRAVGAALQFTPSFELTHLHSKDFITGISSPIDPKVVKYWLDRGLDRRIVLLLFFSAVEIVETRSEKGPVRTIRIMNSPRDAIGRHPEPEGRLQRDRAAASATRSRISSVTSSSSTWCGRSSPIPTASAGCSRAA